MQENADLHKALQRLETATAGLSAAQAVGLIDEAIADPRNANYRPHFEVHKAGVLWAAGQMQEAVVLLERCAAEHDEIDSAQYFAGEHLLELGQFAQAIRYLSRCIEIAESSGDGWYQDSAYLLRAYSAAKIGRFDMARRDLSAIKDDDPMSWLKAEPMVSKSSIERMIQAQGHPPLTASD